MPSPQHRFIRSDGFSLRGLLIVPFVLQIIAAVTAVGLLSFRNGQQAVNDLATQLQTEIATRITQQLQSYVTIPHNINQVNGTAFARGDVSIVEPEGEHTFWQQAKIFPNTNLVYCGAEQDGSFLGVGRSVGDRSLQMVVYNQASNRLGQYYALDNQGQQRYLIRTGDKPYDARARPWYTAALAANGPTWSEIYLDFDTQLPTITASLPVYSNSGNQVLGVCATDFILPEEMSQFLKTLQVGKTGETFIMDRQGTLVSTSVEEAILAEQGDSLRRIRAEESQNPLIQGTATHLREAFGTLGQIERSQKFSFHLDGQRQYVALLPFNDGRGLDWLIVVVIPEVDFMAQIHASARNTVILCLIALAIATLLGIAIVRRLTQPILTINKAAQDLAAGHLTRQVQVQGVRELRTLGQSFNQMAQQLHQSFADLETKNHDLRVAKEALRIAEENYRSIFENALEGIFQSTPTGHFLSVNPAMAQIHGYDSPAEMVKAVQDIGSQIYLHQEDRDQFAQQMLQTNEVKEFEYQAKCKDGRIVWLQENTRAVRNNQGQLIYYEGILQDITLRKRQEADLLRQLQDLKVEIDQQQRDQEVAQITQSDYFQDVRDAIESSPLDQFWS